MTSFVLRRPLLAGLALVLVALSLMVLQPVDDATAAETGTVTKSGTGRFSDLKVTISQTEHLRNQVVRVSWTGAEQTSASGRRFFSHYLQIMQCWGDEAAPKREKCQYGGIFDDQRGGQATSNREVVNNGQVDDPAETYSAPFPATAVVPFQSVTGKTVTDRRNEFFDSQSTNEINYGRTSADGTGEEFFEVQTGREAAGLGCGGIKDDGEARDCWLVVVPRDDQEVNGLNVSELPDNRLETSPLAASNFANAISFRMDFDPVTVTCAIGAAERRILGNESAIEAVSQWQPALCPVVGTIFGYSQISDGAARTQTLTANPPMAVVNRPLEASKNTDGRLLTYAPIAVDAIGIGLVIERTPRDSAPDAVKLKRGTRVLDLKLNARLVAKLLTQSYTAAVTGDTKHVEGNPRWLTEDEEFLAMNPEFRQLQNIGQLYGITNPLGLADANRALWEWIESDATARGFINGTKDKWGTKVNPFYKNLDLDLDSFPRADPTCIKFPSGSNQADLCALDHLAYAADFHAATRGAIRGLTLANDTWDPGPPQRYRQNPAQAPGERAVLVVTDTATAARFKISMARLKNAAGTFVAPTQGSMSAALADMKDGPTKGVLAANPGTKVSAAYPLTEVNYAMTAPRQLDADEAKDYAGFITYAAGPGQNPGISPGDLPEGYLPLPTALRKQALAVAALVAKRGGPVPETETEETPEPGGEQPIGEGTAELPVAGGSVVAGSPSVVPELTAPGQVAPLAAATTSAIGAGALRFALLGALILGLLALAARPALAGYRLVQQARIPDRETGPTGSR